jgi:hypothetical protein
LVDSAPQMIVARKDFPPREFKNSFPM